MTKKVKYVLFAIISIALLSVIATGVLASTHPEWIHFFDTAKDLENDTTILATVNGEPIYESTVALQEEFASLSYDKGLEQINVMDISETEKEELRNQLEANQKTSSEILDEYIKQAVILQEADRVGIEVTLEDAREIAETQYFLLKNSADESEANALNFRFLEDYMDSMGYTEEEYLDKLAESYQKTLTVKQFYDALPQINTLSTESVSAEDYVQMLIDKAEIVIFDNNL